MMQEALQGRTGLEKMGRERGGRVQWSIPGSIARFNTGSELQNKNKVEEEGCKEELKYRAGLE